MLWLLTAMSGDPGGSPVEEDLDHVGPCVPCASLPELDAVHVSSFLNARPSACIMLLVRSKLMPAPFGIMLLLWADSMPGCTDPMLFGLYTTPSGSIPLLTDNMPLCADNMPLWLGSMPASAGVSVPLGCRIVFIGSAALWLRSRGGGG